MVNEEIFIECWFLYCFRGFANKIDRDVKVQRRYGKHLNETPTVRRRKRQPACTNGTHGRATVLKLKIDARRRFNDRSFDCY